MVLALTRYLSQERLCAAEAMHRVAACSPKSLARAVRYSRLVLRPGSARRIELDQVAAGNAELTELCAVLDIFAKEHHARLVTLSQAQNALASLTAFEFLIYASLYAFEHLMPDTDQSGDATRRNDATRQVAWDAINDLLIWKMGTAKPESLTLNDTAIGHSVREHLAPSISAGGSENSEHARLHRSFESLLSRTD